MRLDSSVTIRAATARDIPGIIDLERQSSTASHWSEQQYREFFQAADSNRVRLVLVAELMSPRETLAAPGTVLGFLVAHHLAPDWELENIVVSEAVRQKGLGTRLLDALRSRARETNSDSVFLEVRESNRAARSFYEKASFRQDGRRRNYYEDPLEDALLYSLKMH